MFSGFMIHAWEVGTIVAIVAGVVGFFVVLRDSAFPAHAIPNGAFAGAAGASLIGVSTLVGLGVFAAAGALAIAALGRRTRNDVATALVLVGMLAVGAAFLSQSTSYEPEVFSLLFGQILGVGTNQLLPVAVVGLGSCLIVIALARPLLLSSLTPDIARARGLRTDGLNVVFLLIVAAVTTIAVPVVGTLLMFTLIIGPPAAARGFTKRPVVALSLSALIAVVVLWAAIASAYAMNWPVGFFVGIFSALAYGLSRLWQWRR